MTDFKRVVLTYHKPHPQLTMFNAAHKALADRDEAALHILFGPNPVSDADLKALVEKYPQRWARYFGYIGKR